MRIVPAFFAPALLATLLVAPAMGMPLDAEPLAPIRYGMDEPAIDALASMGARPELASVWAGAWLQTHGWDHVDAQLDNILARNVTPVVHFWYWGDAIAPTCVENGCQDPYHATALSQDGWREAVDGLAARLAQKLQGREAIVILESEFNKQGIESPEFAPRFDALLAEQAQRLRAAAPGVRVALGFGSWGEDAWERFPLAVAASDLVGVQTMRASTRNDASSYEGAPEKALRDVARLARFGKPILLTDVAFSSFPAPEYEARQARALESLLGLAPQLQRAGVEGVLYRSLDDDPWMDPANYFGEAERHWGLTTAEGAPKPALEAWVRAAAAP